MIKCPESKCISNILRQNSNGLRKKLYTVFEESILSSDGEVQFIQSLVKKLDASLESLRINGLEISCRSKVIHQRPIVIYSDSKCELGDLLVVVKYHLSSGEIETKSIIYQVKLSRKNSLNCTIDEKQLKLLSKWPEFSFGRAENKFNIRPHTLELGSFMLEPRNPKSGCYLSNNRNHCYGITPYALLVHDIGPRTVNINSFPYTRGDVHNFFSHIVFEIGEHHQNKNVKRLIDALYRYAELAPDPPDEFKGYSKKSKKDGFAIIEINIKKDENIASSNKSNHLCRKFWL
jgi:hypothetical protein